MKLISILFSITLFFLLSIFGIQSLWAQEGGPPMLTDDSDTPKRGEWETNFAFIFNGSKEEYTLVGPTLDINYGLRDNIQLNVEMPWVKTEGAAACQ